MQHAVQGDRKFTGGWLFTFNPTLSTQCVTFPLLRSEGESGGLGDAEEFTFLAWWAPTQDSSHPSQTQVADSVPICGSGQSTYTAGTGTHTSSVVCLRTHAEESTLIQKIVRNTA